MTRAPKLTRWSNLYETLSLALSKARDEGTEAEKLGQPGPKINYFIRVDPLFREQNTSPRV